MPSLPLEIEAQIFEHCARAHPKDIPKLMRVARRVNYWLEPILYSCIVIGTHFNINITDPPVDCNVFKRAKPPRGVQRLCLTYHAPHDQSVAFLRSCPNITALACWSPCPAAHSIIHTFQHLRTLSISATHWQAKDIPPLPNLTRLEFVVLEPLFDIDISFHPNVTHVGFLDYPGKADYSFVPTLMRENIELLYVLFYYPVDKLEEGEWAEDDRVVLMCRGEINYNAINSWKEDTIWATAEKKRNASKAEATTFV